VADAVALRQGPAAVQAAYTQAQSDGISHLIVDAISDADLISIGTASADLALITGGSGVALGLPQNFRAQGLLKAESGGTHAPAPAGRSVILAGSCSAMTRQQVAAAKAAGLPSFQIDPLAIAAGKLTPGEVVAWVLAQDAKTPLVYSSADPADVASVQAKLGRANAGESIEHLLGAVAAKLADQGFTRFLVAGGETSGAVVAALGVEALRIGPEIDPGVPWTTSLTGRSLALALKSGNFGAPDFFLKAWNKLP